MKEQKPKGQNSLSARGCQIARRTDVCPRCKRKLTVHSFHVLFKDVVECYCGHVWIATNLDVIQRLL